MQTAWRLIWPSWSNLPTRIGLPLSNRKADGRPGTVALMRTDTANRTIEVGWVVYGEKLKRTRVATEAQFLLMQYVFETLHYRRYEWKCDALNAPSCRAAERLGFTYERHVPPRPHQPRPQPRYQLVFGNRQRMAGTQTAFP